MATAEHRWKIFRSGGVDQVAIQSGADLAHLHELDPKLWIALSMPTKGVDLDVRTLGLLDRDGDGFVRQHEVLEAVKWLCETYKDPGTVLAGGDTVELGKLAEGPMLAGAKRLLTNLGRANATQISLADATSADKMFADTLFNGDGVVPPEAAEGATRAAIEAIIATAHGSTPDRSGKPGVDAARIDGFFADAKALLAWHAAADAKVKPLGDATAAAAAAVRAVRSKVDDFFTRCRVVAFDGRAAGPLNAGDAALAALGAQELSPASSELANLPLARVDEQGRLPLKASLNPAWQDRIAALHADAVVPLIGARDALDDAAWQQLLAKLAPYETWLAAKPTDRLDPIALDRVRAAIAVEAEIRAALAQDLAVKPEVDAIADIEKLCRFQRDMKTLLENYVNFSRFYGKKGGIFQAGTLYLDGRACNLVFDVIDPAKHGTLAPMAGTFLAYCDCTRGGGEKRTIAAAFTAGDIDNLFVGRNGVFVDRKGNDWQATITKLVDNPISLRQAFWAPYKKLVRAIEERVAKRAADQAAEANTVLEGTAQRVAYLDKQTEKVEKKPAIDVGTVAALGVAIGGIAAVVTAVMGGVFGLGLWAPAGILAVMIAISTPSIVLAFIKLRRRNLGPLLDANGWAINALTHINVPFGTALTDRPALPPGAIRNFKDPYAEKRRPWRFYTVVAFLAVLGGSWYFGKLDHYLPFPVRSTSVLGDRAPAYEPPTPEKK